MKKIYLSVMMSVIAVGVFAAESIDWRGPDRTGIFDETNLLTEWPAEGPEQLWSITGIGEGYSSMCVTKDKIFLTALGSGKEASKEFLIALDKSGKVLWRTEYGKATTLDYPPARTTPVLHEPNNCLYVLSGDGQLACVSSENGKLVWQVDAAKLVTARPGSWGFSEAPLIVDDKVIFTAGGKSHSFAAFNIADGSVEWKSDPLDLNAAYVSPKLFEHNGKKQFVGHFANAMAGVDPADGKIMWFFEYKSVPQIFEGSRRGGESAIGGIHAVTPLYKDNMLFMSTAYNLGSLMLRLNDNLDKVECAWVCKALDIHHGGAVLLGDFIFGMNNNGNLLKIDWATGEEKARMRTGKGVTISADGMLYCFNEQGLLQLIDPETMTKKGEVKIKVGTLQFWAHPVISDGVIYVRHGDALAAFDIRQK